MKILIRENSLAEYWDYRGKRFIVFPSVYRMTKKAAKVSGLSCGSILARYKKDTEIEWESLIKPASGHNNYAKAKVTNDKKSQEMHEIVMAIDERKRQIAAREQGKQL